MSWHGTGRLRVGFVMEQVLGHVTHYHTLRRMVECEPGVAPHWVEGTYSGKGRLEQYTLLSPSVRGTLRGFLQVRDGLRGQSLDALLFHTQKPVVFQWDRMARVPTVLSLDVTPKQYDALGQFYDHLPDGDTLVAHLKHRINRHTFALARLVVAWNNWVRDSLVSEYSVPAEKIRVIPPGVNLQLWTLPPEGRQRADLPRVLFVGGDFDRRGGPLLLEWFREQGRHRCELDLVTRAPIVPEPGVRVHRDVIGNSVEARRLFFGADVFVLPSLGECFGIVSVEAMAAGLPVITTRVGGATDLVEDGKTGFLVAPGDRRALTATLDQLLVDVPLRRAMGERGRARAHSKFDAAANASALLACLQAVSTSNRRGTNTRSHPGRTIRYDRCTSRW